MTVDEQIEDFLKEMTDREKIRFEKLLQLREARLNFAKIHRNTRGELLEFKNYPHIKDWYETLATEVVIQGSVQSMKSEWLIIDHLAAAFIGLSAFVVLPKIDLRNTFVQNRIDKCVEMTPEYKKIVKDSYFSNVAMKFFGRGVAKYVGSNVFADFREFPADGLYVEEVDQCDDNNVNIAQDRLRASPYQIKRYLGNPKYKNGGINKLFLISDQREWEVPCKKCFQYSEMDWFKTVVESTEDKDGNVISYRLRDKDWIEGSKRDIKIICPFCQGELDRTSLEGKWVPKNPDSKVEGYHVSMLCSSINSIADMWQRFKAAQNDLNAMQHFFNSDLGLPAEVAGSKVTNSLLSSCVEEDYVLIDEGTIAYAPAELRKGPTSMGVDVGNNFDIRISQLHSNKRKMVFVGKVKNTGIEPLLDLCREYKVEKCVIDVGPQTALVQEFQELAMGEGIEVWTCRYGSEGSEKRIKFNSINREVTVDRTYALDKSLKELKIKQNVLPMNFDKILKGDYAKEMCASIRNLTQDDSGNERIIWTKGEDHQRHCDSYDKIAADMMKESVIEEVIIG